MEGTLRTAPRGVLLAFAVLAAGVSCTSTPRQPADQNSGGVAASPTAKHPVAQTPAPKRRASTGEVAGRNFKERKNSPPVQTSTPRGQRVQVANSETRAMPASTQVARAAAPANGQPRPDEWRAAAATEKPEDSVNDSASASSGQSAPANGQPRTDPSRAGSREAGGWGWFGLLGLLGLAGFRRSRERHERLPMPAGAISDRRVRIYDVDVQPSLKAPR